MRVFSLALLAMVLWCAAARCEVVVLNDGTRIEGKIQRTGDGWTITKADGTFTLAVLPGPGVLGVTSPRRELHLPALVSSEHEKRVLGNDWNPGRRIALFNERGGSNHLKGEGEGIVMQSAYDALILLLVDGRARSLGV